MLLLAHRSILGTLDPRTVSGWCWVERCSPWPAPFSPQAPLKIGGTDANPAANNENSGGGGGGNGSGGGSRAYGVGGVTRRREHGFPNTLAVAALSEEKSGSGAAAEFSADGTVLFDGTPRVLQIGGIPVEAQLEGTILYLRNRTSLGSSGKWVLRWASWE